MYGIEYEDDILLLLRMIKFLHMQSPDAAHIFCQSHPVVDMEELLMVIDEVMWDIFDDVNFFFDEEYEATVVQFLIMHPRILLPSHTAALLWRCFILPKRDMNDLLKKRMSATQQAAEIVVGDEAYETLFRGAPAPEASRFCDLPIDRLRPFFTADIGFHPYSPEKLRAFSQQLAEQGIYERVIVRPIPDSNDYEILAGHNRTRAWQMTGHDMIPAEVVSADDARAVSIAVATNLLRRQDLTIIERGKAYKAVLDAEKRQGARTDIGTSGENRQKFLTREIVADFFGVTEYEIRKAIKLAGLIEPLADILEDTPRKLPIACAELIADYDATTQQAFVEMCSIEGYTLNKATVQKITRTCPPPSAGKQEIYAVWRQARAEEAQRRTAPPKKISFDRRKFAPYLQKLGSDKELEELFLAFLRQRVG